MIDNYDWIFDGINNISNIKPDGFLLRKAGHRQQLDAFKLKPIRTNYFRNILKTKLEEIKQKFEDREIKITKFYREDADESAISVLDVDKHVWVKNTIREIFQTASANPIDKLDRMENVKFSAMLFKIPNSKSIMAIDFVAIYSEAFEAKIGLVATYDDMGLEQLDRNAALVFKFGLPCIYFEETDKLLVMNKKDTEKIFNMLEHYQKKATQKFNELENEGIIEIDKTILQSELKKIGSSRRINNMIEGGAFTTDISIYKKYETFLKKHPDVNDELGLKIENGRVIIDTKNHFDSFLHFTEYNLGQSVIDDSVLYIALKKRLIKTRNLPKS